MLIDGTSSQVDVGSARYVSWSVSSPGRPARLHPNAYVVKDQRATRHFYEDLLGLPLVATWTEIDDIARGAYCHTFFALADGSALAFFQFAEPGDHETFGPSFRPTPFVHIALSVDDDTQRATRARLEEDGVPTLTIDHGYCVSLYVTDPDGLVVELTRDHPDVEVINQTRRALAAEDLERWLAGDHTSNNEWRVTT
jgi:catechol 2,3-dioxygenase-like lactoylglutathione lyase family enzyme